MQSRLFKLLGNILFVSLLLGVEASGAELAGADDAKFCETPADDVSFYRPETLPSCWREQFADFTNCYSLEKSIYPESLKTVYERIGRRFSKDFLLNLEKDKEKEGFRISPVYQCAEKKLCTQSILDSCAFVELFWLNGITPNKSVSDFNHDLVGIVIDGLNSFSDFKLALAEYVNRLQMMDKYGEFANSEIKECRGGSEKVGDIYIKRGRGAGLNEALASVPLRRCKIKNEIVLWLGNLKTKEWIRVPSRTRQKILEKLSGGEDEILFSDKELALFLR